MDPPRYGQSQTNHVPPTDFTIEVIHFQPPIYRQLWNSGQWTNTAPPNDCKLYKAVSKVDRVWKHRRDSCRSLPICYPAATIKRVSSVLGRFWACLHWLDLACGKPHPSIPRGWGVWLTAQSPRWRQPPNNGQDPCSQCARYSEVPLLWLLYRRTVFNTKLEIYFANIIVIIIQFVIGHCTCTTMHGCSGSNDFSSPSKLINFTFCFLNYCKLGSLDVKTYLRWWHLVERSLFKWTPKKTWRTGWQSSSNYFRQLNLLHHKLLL